MVISFMSTLRVSLCPVCLRNLYVVSNGSARLTYTQATQRTVFCVSIPEHFLSYKGVKLNTQGTK